VIRKVMAFAAAATLVVAVPLAFACDHDGNKTSAAVASNGGTCTSHASASQASLASTAGGDHCANMKSASAGDHCSAHASMTAAGGSCSYDKSRAANCVYGRNSVAISGDCPSATNTDFALAVKAAKNRASGRQIAQALKATPGVAAVTVDFGKHMAYVCADGSKCDAKSLVECLQRAGYSNARLADTGHKYCNLAHGKDKV